MPSAFVESAILRVIDESTGPISKIEAALRKLDATARQISGRMSTIGSASMAGMQKQIGQVDTLAASYERLGLAMRGAGTSKLPGAGNGSAIATQTQQINAQTSAISRQTGVVRSHSQALDRDARFALRHTATAIGVPYHAAASTIEANHLRDNGMPGVAKVVAGAMVFEGAKHAFHHAAEMDTLEKQWKAMGASDENLAEMDTLRTKLTGQFKNLSTATLTHLGKDFTSVFGDSEEALRILPSGAAFMSALQSLGVKGNHDAYLREAFSGVKSLEISGKPLTKEQTDDYLGNVLSLRVAYGEQAKVGAYLTAQRTMGAAGFGLNDEARFGMFPAMVQEFGERAGTMVGRAYRAVQGGKKFSEMERTEMRKYGVYDAERAAMIGRDDFKANPYEFAADLARKVLAKENLDIRSDAGRAKLQDVFSKMFGDSNAQKFFLESVFNWPKLVKDAALVRSIHNDLERMKRDSGNIKFDTWEGAVAGVNAQMQNLQTALLGSSVSPMIGVAEHVAGAFNRATGYVKDMLDPNQPSWLKAVNGATLAAQTGGLILGGGKLAGMALDKLTGAGAMKAAASSHTVAANKLSFAAGQLSRAATHPNAVGGRLGPSAVGNFGGLDPEAAPTTKLGKIKGAISKGGTALNTLLALWAIGDIADIVTDGAATRTWRRWTGADKGKNPFLEQSPEQKAANTKVDVLTDKEMLLGREYQLLRTSTKTVDIDRRAQLEKEIAAIDEQILAAKKEQLAADKQQVGRREKFERDAALNRAVESADKIAKESTAMVGKFVEPMGPPTPIQGQQEAIANSAATIAAGGVVKGIGEALPPEIATARQRNATEAALDYGVAFAQQLAIDSNLPRTPEAIAAATGTPQVDDLGRVITDGSAAFQGAADQAAASIQDAGMSLADAGAVIAGGGQAVQQGGQEVQTAGGTMSSAAGTMQSAAQAMLDAAGKMQNIQVSVTTSGGGAASTQAAPRNTGGAGSPTR